jgi:hypothetical protein
MAKATDTGDCGCGQSLRTRQVDPDKPVGNDWTDVVQDIIRDSAEQALAHLKTHDQGGEGEVTVPVRITAFVRFPFKDQELDGEGLVGCVCTNDGSVCVCKGQCDFDACCDVDAGTSGPIVAFR